ncbi:HTH-type transcriptional activator RhaS [compost metagenome]
MEADVHTLYESDFYRILDFKCRCKECGTSKPEYASAFTISFIRTGNFQFNVFRNSHDAHTSRILMNKPGYEHTVTHFHYSVPDECTIFEFKHPFFQLLKEDFKNQFFHNNDLHSLLLNANAELDLLHVTVLQKISLSGTSRLEIDSLVLDIVYQALRIIDNSITIPSIPVRLKKYHLPTVEKAKQYISTFFVDDISLNQIADHCNISVFHFSRLFKLFTGYSPYFYLLNVRLKNAEMLLRSTALPITDVCFSSGFNSIDRFSTAFKQKYHYPPSKIRLV